MKGLFINAFPWHNVAWLYDTVRPEHIEDKDDLWVKTWGTPLNETHHGGKSEKAVLQEEEEEWEDGVGVVLRIYRDVGNKV